MEQRVVLGVGLEEEQQEPLMVGMPQVPLVAAAVAEITAPVEVVPMAVVGESKTVGIPVVQLMEAPVESPGESVRVGHRLAAARVMLGGAAAAVTSSMGTAPILQGRWEPQGTMVT